MLATCLPLRGSPRTPVLAPDHNGDLVFPHLELSTLLLTTTTNPPHINTHQVLLDAPCSALGLRPSLRVGGTSAWSAAKSTTVDSGQLRQTALYQRLMLRQAAKALKPGGRLVWVCLCVSVCVCVCEYIYICQKH